MQAALLGSKGAAAAAEAAAATSPAKPCIRQELSGSKHTMLLEAVDERLLQSCAMLLQGVAIARMAIQGYVGQAHLLCCCLQGRVVVPTEWMQPWCNPGDCSQAEIQRESLLQGHDG